jgi:signal peptidase I
MSKKDLVVEFPGQSSGTGLSSVSSYHGSSGQVSLKDFVQPDPMSVQAPQQNVPLQAPPPAPQPMAPLAPNPVQIRQAPGFQQMPPQFQQAPQIPVQQMPPQVQPEPESLVIQEPPQLQEDPQGPKPPITRTELRKGYKAKVLKTLIKDLVFVFVAALVLAILLKQFIFSPFLVPSGSMENTLKPGDRIIANKTALWGGVHRGDIVVFYDKEGWLSSSTLAQEAAQQKEDENFFTPFLKFVGLVPENGDSFLVKRILGMPGDHITCKGGDNPLYINGVELKSEPYIKTGTHASSREFDITVPEGKIWVMGDNRDNSADSRYHMTEDSKGFVDISEIVGTVPLIIFPNFGWIDSDVSKLTEIPDAQ